MNLKKQLWKTAKIGEIAEVQYGSSHKSEDLASGYKTFRMNEIVNGVAIDNGLMKTTDIDEKEFRRYKLVEGDILFNRTNSFEHVGRTGIFLLSGDYMFASYLLRVRVNRDIASQFYLNGIMNSDWFQSNIKRYATKAVGQANINAKSLANFSIPVPPFEEQKRIASVLQSIETTMEVVESQAKNLLELKNKLLKDLFAGKNKFYSLLQERDFETVRFDTVAINISERVEPKATTLTTYVGLEHLDADCLKIERTGTPSDVIGTKLKIYKGDIIFGKRRAYLRKVAVSHFDGIASAHSMILRANEENIEKEFLPYFMQSDTFMERAVQISEGSLSPTIKWKTLGAQQFLIPKKEKQKQLAVIFEQLDMTRDQLKRQKAALKNLKQRLLSEILG